eukprot:TRINITY_DN299_c4_g1_i1.p1 TRINITY_DN299_c4_g1~~TRINITY_DN299_c4_g1_i1.p1  ORF type:complete len:530 (+),score=191.24 TRINITY_DN299_c4_g1_i1:75-1664(+)
MSTFTSAAEMALAKRKHTCNMAYSPPAAHAAAPADASVGRHSERQSHSVFEHDKQRHLTEILNSPPRARETPRESARRFDDAPPYHTSCRELSHEKIEHLTPLYPSEHRAHRGATHDLQVLTSNEELSSVKRKHKHEMDSIQRMRGSQSYQPHTEEGQEVSVARSVQVTSAGQFSADKALHRRAIDEGYERRREEYEGARSPHCTSAEQLSHDKSLHRHRMDECRGDVEPAPVHETDEDGKFVSVSRLSREIKAHRYELDSLSPRAPARDDREDPAVSQRAFEKKKKNHDIGMGSPTPIRVRSEAVGPSDKSNLALTQSKRRHSKDMSGFQGAKTGIDRYNSNGEYSTVKRKHRHTVDTYGDEGTVYTSTSRRREEEANVQCLSARRLTGDKHRHKHRMDSHREGYVPQVEADDGVCRSNHGFAESKRRHRHEIDACSPERSHQRQSHAHVKDEDLFLTSNQAMSHAKRGHRIELDSHSRSPRRDIFESRAPPVVTSGPADSVRSEDLRAPPAVATPPTPAVEAEASYE